MKRISKIKEKEWELKLNDKYIESNNEFDFFKLLKEEVKESPCYMFDNTGDLKSKQIKLDDLEESSSTKRADSSEYDWLFNFSKLNQLSCDLS